MEAANTGVLVPGNAWFTYHNCDAWRAGHFLDPGNTHTRDLPVTMPWANWNGTDTIVAFLNTWDGTATWDYEAYLDLPWGYATRAAMYNDTPDGFYRCLVPDWFLPYVSGRAYDNSRRSRIAPPVWPGLDLVTLLTPVALAEGVTITEPMHGVILTITTVPVQLGAWDFDGVPSWGALGAVAFVDDNGSYERAQTFGFQQALVCAQSMALAAGCVIRTASGTVGTVTPWVYTL